MYALIALSLIGSPVEGTDHGFPPVVYVTETQTGWNATGHQTVVVTMNPLGDWVGRCLDMGGEPVLAFPDSTPTALCERVDN